MSGINGLPLPEDFIGEECEKCMSLHVEGEGPYECEINWTEAKVLRLPECNACSEVAKYDAMIKGANHSWGYWCETHFISESVGKLGLGLGQRLVLETDQKGSQ